jgi:hypothetical protein
MQLHWSIAMLMIEHYTAERIPNPSPSGEVSLQLFHKVRNDIVQTCRTHGPTGPMGLFPVGHSFKDSGEVLDAWESGDADPAYYVIDDQYNDEFYQYVEVCAAAHFTAEWIEDIMETLARWPGWGIGIVNINEGYVLVFSDKLMVNGLCFASADELPSVITAAKKCLA